MEEEESGRQLTKKERVGFCYYCAVGSHFIREEEWRTHRNVVSVAHNYVVLRLRRRFVYRECAGEAHF